MRKVRVNTMNARNMMLGGIIIDSEKPAGVADHPDRFNINMTKDEKIARQADHIQRLRITCLALFAGAVLSLGVALRMFLMMVAN